MRSFILRTSKKIKIKAAFYIVIFDIEIALHLAFKSLGLVVVTVVFRFMSIYSTPPKVFKTNKKLSCKYIAVLEILMETPSHIL